MFEWDPQKAARNLAKHGVSFAEASSCFEDSGVLALHDVTHSRAEDRYVALAKSNANRVLAVVFTVRRDQQGETIFRIITARQASKKARLAYDQA